MTCIALMGVVVEICVQVELSTAYAENLLQRRRETSMQPLFGMSVENWNVSSHVVMRYMTIYSVRCKRSTRAPTVRDLIGHDIVCIVMTNQQ